VSRGPRAFNNSFNNLVFQQPQKTVSGSREGLVAARIRGRVGGRPTVVTPEILRVARDMLPNPDNSNRVHRQDPRREPRHALQPHPRPARAPHQPPHHQARHDPPAQARPDPPNPGLKAARPTFTRPHGPWHVEADGPNDFFIIRTTLPAPRYHRSSGKSVGNFPGTTGTP
jgi:hypothetical protein